MSTYDYTKIQNTFIKMVNKFGRQMVLRVNVNTGTPSNPTITPTDKTIQAFSKNYKDFQIDGDLIKRTDKRFSFISDVKPKRNYQIVDGDEVFNIEFVEEKKPGDTTLIYKVQGRL